MTRLSRKAGVNVAGWLFVLPLLIGIGLLFVYPLVRVVQVSLENNNGVQGTWVGLNNYRYLLADPRFGAALRNTAVLTALAILTGLPAGLVVALLLNSVSRFRHGYLGIIFSSHMVSVVAASSAFLVILHPSDGGPANSILAKFGLSPLRWFSGTSTSQVSIILMGLWLSVGFTALIYFTGLQNISSEIVEAAMVDGAGLGRLWRSILVPLLRPMTIFLGVTHCIMGFRRFSDVYVIGGIEGSPGGTLETLMIYIFRAGFQATQFGLAAAASIVVVVIILTLTMVSLRLFGMRRQEW